MMEPENGTIRSVIEVPPRVRYLLTLLLDQVSHCNIFANGVNFMLLLNDVFSEFVTYTTTWY